MVGFSGQVKRTIGRSFSGSVSFTGVINRIRQLAFTAALSFSGSLLAVIKGVTQTIVTIVVTLRDNVVRPVMQSTLVVVKLVTKNTFTARQRPIIRSKLKATPEVKVKMSSNTFKARLGSPPIPVRLHQTSLIKRLGSTILKIRMRGK